MTAWRGSSLYLWLATAATIAPLSPAAAAGRAVSPDFACAARIERMIENSPIRFQRRSTAFESGSLPFLDRIADAMQACPAARLTLADDGEDQCSGLADWRLSRGRAWAVADALAARGVEASRLTARGVPPGSRVAPVPGADTRPPCTGGSGSGRTGPDLPDDQGNVSGGGGSGGTQVGPRPDGNESGQGAVTDGGDSGRTGSDGNAAAGSSGGNEASAVSGEDARRDLPPASWPWPWLVLLGILVAALVGWLAGRRFPTPIPTAQPALPPPALRPPPRDPPRNAIGIPIAVGPPDDLLLIKGIGPKLNTLLFGLGVRRFDQIAAWSPEDVERVDRHLHQFHGRIGRDSWIEQAQLLERGAREEFESRFGKVNWGD